MFLSWGLGSPSKVGRGHLPIEALIKISVYQKEHLPKGGFIPKGEFILKRGWGTFFADGELLSTLIVDQALYDQFIKADQSMSYLFAVQTYIYAISNMFLFRFYSKGRVYPRKNMFIFTSRK
jgi:hypothetical protein